MWIIKKKANKLWLTNARNLFAALFCYPFLVYLPFDVLKIYCANICKVFFSSFLWIFWLISCDYGFKAWRTINLDGNVPECNVYIPSIYNETKQCFRFPIKLATIKKYKSPWIPYKFDFTERKWWKHNCVLSRDSIANEEKEWSECRT